MKKKLLVLALAAVFAFSVMACGNSNQPATDADSTNQETQEDTTEPEDTTDTTVEDDSKTAAPIVGEWIPAVKEDYPLGEGLAYWSTGYNGKMVEYDFTDGSNRTYSEYHAETSNEDQLDYCVVALTDMFVWDYGKLENMNITSSSDERIQFKSGTDGANTTYSLADATMEELYAVAVADYINVDDVSYVEIDTNGALTRVIFNIADQYDYYEDANDINSPIHTGITKGYACYIENKDTNQSYRFYYTEAEDMYDDARALATAQSINFIEFENIFDEE